jgi:predicted transcriptional regulator
MKVLLSIKPEYVSKIFSGEKKFEYRRLIFKRKVDSIIVYASDPTKLIIGEFEIGEVIYNKISELWEQTSHDSGTTKEELFGYFKNCEKGYAIEILNPRIYAKPFSLSEMNILFAPQSFVYLSADYPKNNSRFQNIQPEFLPL